MSEITVDILDDTLEALKGFPEAAGNTPRMAAAARLVGVSRSVFRIRLGDCPIRTMDR